MWLALTLAPPAWACSCFPPEVQAQTARDTLATARLAVYARVLELSPGGQARLLVLESFKGPAVGAVFIARPRASACEATPFVVGEEALLLSFGDVPEGCDKQAPGHYLLDALRAVVATPPR